MKSLVVGGGEQNMMSFHHNQDINNGQKINNDKTKDIMSDINSKGNEKYRVQDNEKVI